MNTDNNNEIIPFLFGESAIRTTISLDGEPLFCARDVCAALGLENNRKAVESLKDKEKITVTNGDGNPRAGVPHQMTYIKEPGLYRLIFKSRKAEAQIFQDWVFTEVLPNLRKHGFYGHREQAVSYFLKDLLGMGLSPRDATRLALASFPPLPAPKCQPGGELDPREEYVAQDIAEILSAMKQGVTYAVGDLQGILPAGHTLAQGSPEACRARLGKLMEKARGHKFVERVRHPRRSLYRLLPQAEIVSLFRDN